MTDHAALDHRALAAGLSADERRFLTETRDRPGLWRLGLHGGAILLFGGLIAAQVPGWPFLLVPQGIAVVFTFTLMHEATHQTAFRSAWINRWVTRVCGLLLCLPPLWFRYFHFAHHRYTADAEKDPELAVPKPESWGEYVVHVSGLPVWRSQIAALIACARGTADAPYLPQSARPRLAAEARWMLAIYAALAAGSAALGSAVLLWVWIIPALFGQPFLRLYLLAEHGRCPRVANMLENSRTTFTTAFMRALAWNMPYHAEHHAMPTVPFHKLRALHEITKAHLRSTERGYARFNARYVAEFGAKPRSVSETPLRRGG